MISPALALNEVTKSLAVMARAASDNVGLSLEQFNNYSEERAKAIDECEDRLDSFADTADNYLIELSQNIEMTRITNSSTC